VTCPQRTTDGCVYVTSGSLLTRTRTRKPIILKTGALLGISNVKGRESKLRWDTEDAHSSNGEDGDNLKLRLRLHLQTPNRFDRYK